MSLAQHLTGHGAEHHLLCTRRSRRCDYSYHFSRQPRRTQYRRVALFVRHITKPVTAVNARLRFMPPKIGKPADIAFPLIKQSSIYGVNGHWVLSLIGHRIAAQHQQSFGQINAVPDKKVILLYACRNLCSVQSSKSAYLAHG